METNEPDPLGNVMLFPSYLDRMSVVAFEDNAPAWRNDQLWQAARCTLQCLIYRYRHQLNQAKEAAGRIQNLLASIDAPLDRLENQTCAQCPSPCCLVADVAYDFRDLLFIHLTDQKLPPGQPRRKGGEVCRYLGPDGCLIPRCERPWICTWYICAIQKNYLADQHKNLRKHLQSVITEISVLRKQIESVFIATVASV